MFSEKNNESDCYDYNDFVSGVSIILGIFCAPPLPMHTPGDMLKYRTAPCFHDQRWPRLTTAREGPRGPLWLCTWRNPTYVWVLPELFPIIEDSYSHSLCFFLFLFFFCFWITSFWVVLLDTNFTILHTKFPVCVRLNQMKVPILNNLHFHRKHSHLA